MIAIWCTLSFCQRTEKKEMPSKDVSGGKKPKRKIKKNSKMVKTRVKKRTQIMGTNFYYI
jgi:hypothetical protein